MKEVHSLLSQITLYTINSTEAVMDYSQKPSGYPGDEVPAVQYPALQEQEHHSSHHVQSASGGDGHHHVATPAPPLPPRRKGTDEAYTSLDGTPGITTEQDSLAAASTSSRSAGGADSHLQGHHTHREHHVGHHHSSLHELDHRHHHSRPSDTAAVGGGSSSSSDGRRTPLAGSDVGHHGQEAIRSAYQVLHGGMEMLRGALLGLGDAAGDALATKSPKLNLVPTGTEHDRELIAKGRAELERGLAALKSATSS